MKIWTFAFVLGLSACDEIEQLPPLDIQDAAMDAALPMTDAAMDAAVPMADAVANDAQLVADAAIDAAIADANPVLDLGSMPDAALPADELSDEFNDPAVDLLAEPGRWQILHPSRADAVRISDGRLNIVAANPPDDAQWSWFEDRYGVLVHRPVTGNFAVSARLRVVDEPNTDQPPTGPFNAGGFVIRDPNGTHARNENWVMYNVGAQGPMGYVRETKKTDDSRSGLYLNPQPFESTALLVCRIEDSLRFWHWADGAWQPERVMPGVTDNQAARWPEVDHTGVMPIQFDLPGLPATLQMGLMTGAWQRADANDMSRTQSFFEYVRVAPVAPQRFDDCPAAFASP